MIIELGIATGAGIAIGIAICDRLYSHQVAAARQAYVDENDFANLNVKAKNDAISAHSRCADALTTVQGKIEDIRELLNRPRTIRKKELASILDGDV